MQEQYDFIGETAGKIYRILEKKGGLALADLQKEIEVTDKALCYQALGWLAREDKINFKKEGRVEVVSLCGASQPA